MSEYWYKCINIVFPVWFREGLLTRNIIRAILCGGDQLSCERVRAQMSRYDRLTLEKRLEGLFPMIEDFHNKMNFLQVIIKKMTDLHCSLFFIFKYFEFEIYLLYLKYDWAYVRVGLSIKIIY